MLAQYGREMQEGNLGGTLTETDATNLETEIDALEKKINEAKFSGDSELANSLYQKQQDLYRKIHGGGPIVGADGRAA
jgi:hypothetical protein